MQRDATHEVVMTGKERPQPDDSTAGADEWLALSDALLAGLVHALNNRVLALSVCAELASQGDSQLASGGMISVETERLQRTSTLIGLLPARERPAEALELPAVLDDAIAIHAQHPRMRAVECVVEQDGTLQPVRAPHWALLRLLLIVADAAKAGAQASGLDRAVLRLAGDESVVRLCAAAPGERRYGARMAAVCGGTLAREGEELVLTLPSLLAVRRRERIARTAGD
jgi:hypothetical protein